MVQGLLRFFEAFQVAVNLRQPQQRLRVLRVGGHQSLVLRQRLLRPLGPQQGFGQLAASLPIFLVLPQGPPVGLHGLVVLIRFLVGARERGQQLRGGGVLPGFFQQRNRLLVVALVAVEGRQRRPALLGARLDLQHLLQNRLGLLQLIVQAVEPGQGEQRAGLSGRQTSDVLVLLDRQPQGAFGAGLLLQIAQGLVVDTPQQAPRRQVVGVALAPLLRLAHRLADAPAAAVCLGQLHRQQRRVGIVLDRLLVLLDGALRVLAAAENARHLLVHVAHSVVVVGARPGRHHRVGFRAGGGRPHLGGGNMVIRPQENRTQHQQRCEEKQTASGCDSHSPHPLLITHSVHYFILDLMR